MADKYHISPTTGRPNKCYASVRSCPVGGPDDHYTSKEDARAGFEKKMEDQTLTSMRKAPRLKTATASKLFAFCGACHKQKGIAYQQSRLGWKYCQECAERKGLVPMKATIASPNTSDTATLKTKNYARTHELSEKIVENAKKKKTLLDTASGRNFDTVLKEMQQLASEGESLRAEQSKVERSIKAIIAAEEVERVKQQKEQEEVKRQTTAKILQATMPEQYYSDKDRVAEVMSRPTRPQNLHTHYTLNAGRLNPMDWSGSGAQFTSKGDNSLVILAERDGKSPRVVSSSGEYFSNPDKELGAPAKQRKQNTSVGGGRDTDRYDLHVVGYVSKTGERFGWIPNKQVAFFVYK